MVSSTLAISRRNMNGVHCQTTLSMSRNCIHALRFQEEHLNSVLTKLGITHRHCNLHAACNKITRIELALQRVRIMMSSALNNCIAVSKGSVPQRHSPAERDPP